MQKIGIRYYYSKKTWDKKFCFIGNLWSVLDFSYYTLRTGRIDLITRLICKK